MIGAMGFRMPLSVVVGGQYGSEGKGKVALQIARSTKAAAVVRVGGPNSGHTGIDDNGKAWIFRQLPASALASDTQIILPAGSLIDPVILLREIEEAQIDPSRIIIDQKASVVLDQHRLQESQDGLIDRIGSTGSGTGAALKERLSRPSSHALAGDHPDLKPFTQRFTPSLMRSLLRAGERIVIEGTQGFGLSLWHSPAYPNATSRDTTAAGFVSETGLAPHDVDDVVLVLRSFPIRVGGNSGPLENEIDWPTVAAEAGLPSDHIELTSATRRVRRVARFHAGIVRMAIDVNQPHRIVVNHLDYVDPSSRGGALGAQGYAFLQAVEEGIGQRVDLVGTSPDSLFDPNLQNKIQ